MDVAALIYIGLCRENQEKDVMAMRMHGEGKDVVRKGGLGGRSGVCERKGVWYTLDRHNFFALNMGNSFLYMHVVGCSISHK